MNGLVSTSECAPLPASPPSTFLVVPGTVAVRRRSDSSTAKSPTHADSDPWHEGRNPQLLIAFRLIGSWLIAPRWFWFFLCANAFSWRRLLHLFLKRLSGLRGLNRAR